VAHQLLCKLYVECKHIPGDFYCDHYLHYDHYNDYYSTDKLLCCECIFCHTGQMILLMQNVTGGTSAIDAVLFVVNNSINSVDYVSSARSGNQYVYYLGTADLSGNYSMHCRVNDTSGNTVSSDGGFFAVITFPVTTSTTTSTSSTTLRPLLRQLRRLRQQPQPRRLFRCR